MKASAAQLFNAKFSADLKSSGFGFFYFYFYYNGTIM
jgi:hypothetical protein